MRRSPFAVLGIAVTATALAACGGGESGTNSTPPTTSNTSNPGSSFSSQLTPGGTTTVNTATTYSVYTDAVGAQTLVGISSLTSGQPPSGDPGWTAVTGGAIVVYPDGSVQITDVLGNFDASQSIWAATNAQALAANPNLQPEVWIVVPGMTSETPLDTTVVAFAPPGGPTMTAGAMRSALGMRSASASGSATSELASVTVYPRGVAMFDNERRTFTVVGSDSDGNYVNLAQANVKWSLGGCNLASSGSGSINGFKNDAARAWYQPPSSGTFSSPDVVTATVTASIAGAGTTTFCAGANAYYYDPSSGVAISGILNSPTAQRLANGIVRFNGGGREFYGSNLVALTNSGGQFARTLPPNRTFTLVGGQSAISGGGVQPATWYSLNPASVQAGGSGSTIASTTYQENVPLQNPFKPLPALDRAIRDAYYVSDAGTENFPFNRPKASGTYKTCTIDAIVNAQGDSLACTTIAASDYYSGWSVVNVAAGSWIFQQPSSQEGGRHVLQVQTTTSFGAPNGLAADANLLKLTCGSTACWNYQELYNPIGFTLPIASPITSSGGVLSGAPAGTILANDGTFDEVNVPGGSFTVAMLRNVYTVGHQVQGQPLYYQTMSFAYSSPSAASATIANAWYNAAALSAGTLDITRTPDSNGDGGFSYTETGTRTYYKGTTPLSLQYTASGAMTPNHTGTSLVTLVSSPDSNENGAAAQLTYVDGTGTCPAPPGSTPYPPVVTPNTKARICGAVSVPNPPVTLSANLGSTNGNPNVALFTIDAYYYTNVVLDPNVNGTALAFHL